jgi:hypothetical protein
MTEYEPGVCNIGPRERRKRRLLGLASMIGGVAYVVAVIAVAWPPLALLATFPFVLGGTIGLLEARESFCAGFAVTERYDLSDAGGDEGRVHNAAAVQRDRLRAGTLIAKAIVVAGALTGAVYVLGVLVYRFDVLAA